MPTLANINGGSLSALGLAGPSIRQDIGGFQQREQDRFKEQSLEDSIRTALGFPAQETPKARRFPSILGRLAPDVAQAGQQAMNDPIAVSEFRGEAQRGLELARELQALPDQASRIRRLADEAGVAATEGRDVSRLADLSNLSPDELDLELQKMSVIGEEMLREVPEFSPQDSFRILSDPQRAGAFAKIMSTNPAIGTQMLAQREKLLNADERRRVAQVRAAAQAAAPKTALAQRIASVSADVQNGLITPEVGQVLIDNATNDATAVPLPEPGFDIPDNTMLADPSNPRAGVVDIPGLTPEQPSALDAARTGKLLAETDVLQNPGLPAQTAAEQQIARLMEPSTDFPDGMPRETAVGIVDGRVVVSRDPITNEVTLVDKASRQVMQLGASPVSDGDAPEQAVPTSDVVGNSFGEQYPNLANTFGTQGLIRDVINTVSEATGAPAPFKDQLRSTSDMQVFAEDMLVDMVRGYGQRVPVFVLKSLNELTPKTGNPFVGPDKAQAKLSGLGSRMVIETNSLETQLQDRRLSPQGRLEIEGQIASLRTGIKRIQTVLSAFDKTPQLQNLAVDPDVQDLLDKWAQ